MLNKLPITLKLLVIIALIVFSVLFAENYYTTVTVERNTQARTTALRTAEARILSNSVGDRLTAGKSSELRALAEMLMVDRSISSVALYRPGNDSPVMLVGRTSIDGSPKVLPSGTAPPGDKVFQAPVQIGKSHVGSVEFRVTERTAAAAMLAEARTRLTVLCLGVLIVVASLLGVIRVVVLGPVTRLSRQLLRVADGELDAGIDIGYEDEIGRLARSCTAMRDAFRAQMLATLQLADRYELATASAGIGTWEWDVSSDIVDRDPRLLRILGQPACERCISMSDWQATIVPSSRDKCKAAMARAFCDDVPYEAELEVERPDGSTLFVKAFGKLSRDDSGVPQRLTGIIYDVTPEKCVEVSLNEAKESAQQFSHNLKQLHEVGLELAVAPTEDALCRLAISRGRTLLGIDRIGIWLFEEDSDALVGTYGIDEHGEVRDEHDALWRLVGTGNREMMSTMAPVVVRKDVDLRDDRGKWVGNGYLATAVMRDATNVVGVIATDNLLTGAAITERQAELLGLYGSLLGTLLLRKKSEQQLQRVNEQFQAAVRGSGAGIWNRDVASGKIFYSARFCELLGYEHGAMGSDMSQFYDALHPADSARVQYAIKAHLESEDNPYDIEYRLRTKCGEYRWFHARGEALRDSSGKPTRMAGSIIDITERKKTENALLESEHRFRTLAAATSQIVWNTDAERRSTGRLHAFGDYSGAASAATREWVKAVHPVDLGELTLAWDEAEQLSQPFEVLARLRRRDGAYRLFNIQGVPITGEDGLILEWIGTCNDVTLRTRIADTLRFLSEKRWSMSGEEFFPAVAQHIAAATEMDYVLIGRVEPSLRSSHTVALCLDGKICDNFTYDLVGTPCDNVVGREFVAFPADVQALFPTHELLKQTKAECYAGVPMWDSSGKSIGHVAVLSRSPMHDIEVVERVLQAVATPVAAEMERTDAQSALQASLDEKTVLLQEVHHRVKNNLQVVCSLLNLQAAKTENTDALASLIDTSNRVRSMSLLHEALYQNANLAHVELSEYIDRVCANLLRSVGTNAQQISLSSNLDGIALGMEEATTCGLMISELVSNALKHAFAGQTKGQITVNGRVLDNGLVELVVSDNGIGLPSSIAIRESNTLGHQLVAMLVERLDGELEVLREGGTRFVITFRPNANEAANVG